MGKSNINHPFNSSLKLKIFKASFDGVVIKRDFFCRIILPVFFPQILPALCVLINHTDVSVSKPSDLGFQDSLV